MKIILYTTNNCQFSKQEKEYLTAQKLAFEEKNLESNREFLTEMLTVSNNFAGTPVTKIEKDNGEIVVLKGFTKDEFDKTLGIVSPAPVQTPAVVSVPTPSAMPVEPIVPVVPPTPPEPKPVPVMPVTPPAPPTPEPVVPPPAPVEPAPVMPAARPEPALTGTSVTPNSGSDPLDAILHDLQEKSESTGTTPVPPTQSNGNGTPITPQAVTPAPTMPPPQASSVPSIPDFKAP